jgi:hypothetical protein
MPFCNFVSFSNLNWGVVLSSAANVLASGTTAIAQYQCDISLHLTCRMGSADLVVCFLAAGSDLSALDLPSAGHAPELHRETAR